MLLGILICLIVIALKPAANFTANTTPSNIFDNGDQIIQLAPNRIAVVDNRLNSGLRGTILVYDYDSTAKTFTYAGTFNYCDYFSNPQKYGIPNN